jgi:hypothetical protein
MIKAVLIFLVGIMLVGCGMGAKESVQNQNGNTNGSGIVAGEMVPSLMEKTPLLYEYQIKNQTEEVVTLEFTSSQRFDYSVQTKDGKEIYLFSSVASFLQALGEEKVKQGEELKYEINLHDLQLAQGEYMLTAWMTPKEGKKYSITTDFTIE